ncbi:hypothetical protein EVAR_87339_1 [Eumeta japonica]|uniref:Uncharacterized protein n=1 Tax=Eumeta variegata TaxID=151549 RepID=A0A4C1YWP3_EUMVA|nr:hypothetical protein EVAR_87339_1 [Eumeta japonica]
MKRINTNAEQTTGGGASAPARHPPRTAGVRTNLIQSIFTSPPHTTATTPQQDYCSQRRLRLRTLYSLRATNVFEQEFQVTTKNEEADVRAAGGVVGRRAPPRAPLRCTLRLHASAPSFRLVCRAIDELVPGLLDKHIRIRRECCCGEALSASAC